MTQPEDNSIDFDARLLKLAREQKRVADANAALNERRVLLYDETIKPLDDAIAANSKRLEDMDAALRSDILQHAISTGELRVHPSVTFRRTVRLVYDKAEVLAELRREGETDYIRVKEELDVRAYEKAWRAGQLRWTNAEESADPTIAIGRLGDLLIIHGE